MIYKAKSLMVKLYNIKSQLFVCLSRGIDNNIIAN